MRLATPAALVLLAAVPAVVAAWIAGRRFGARLALPSVGTLRSVGRPARARLARTLLVLRCLALALLALALARPQSGGVPVVDETNAVDVFVVLDVSSSMASEDFPPLNRLDVARRVISAFVEGRPSDRVGLIAFARYSVLKCPLTLDHELLELQLATATLASGDDDGTAIGMALASSVRHLRRSPARSRVVVLLTDGENNRSTIDPATGAALAAAMGVKIYAIGVGRVAADRSDDASTTAKGAPAGFDEAALRALAEATGGQYFRGDDVATLGDVFTTIDTLERSPVASPRYRGRSEWFAVPALLALLLVAVELVLRHTLLRRLP